MQFILVTGCTAQKTQSVSRGLHAHRLVRAPVRRLAKDWARVVNAASPVCPAGSLYGGPGAAAARRAAEISIPKGSIRWYVLSAGLGLVSAKSQIPAYDLTIAPGHKASILPRCTDSTEIDPSVWWKYLTRELGQSGKLSSILRRYKGALLCIALSSTYLSMLAPSLLALPSNQKKRLRILGIKDAQQIPQRLQGYVMPYDDRLNDRRNPFTGIEGTFAQRTAEHFLTVVGRHRSHGLDKHQQLVRQSLAHWSFPTKPSRKRLSDVQMKKVIARIRRDGITSASAILRNLRDRERVACEQGRLKRLLHSGKTHARKG